MLDAFADDDEDRIVGLDMLFERLYPTKATRRGWACDARHDPLPPGTT